MDLEETVRVAELLYEVNQKLGLVTDFLLKQQGMGGDENCKSFETMLALLVQQAESQQGKRDVENEGSTSGDLTEKGQAGDLAVSV